MSSLTYHIPSVIPFPLLRRISQVNPLIVNYHMVSDLNRPHVSNLYKYRSTNQFREDLNFLCRKYHPIDLHEFLDTIRTGKTHRKNSVLITFDDGFREVFEIAAPILMEKKIPATFFLTRNFLNNKELGADQKKSLIIDKLKNQNLSQSKIEKVQSLLQQNGANPSEIIPQCILQLPYKKRMLLDEVAQIFKLDFNNFLAVEKPFVTSAQVKELIKSGFTIGGHSIDHPYYSELTIDEQLNQTMASVDNLCEEFKLDYKVFAFPYSDISISAEFFIKLNKLINASFGTQGMLMDSAKNNFQRVSVEKFPHSARKTIIFNYLRSYLYSLRGKQQISRE